MGGACLVGGAENRASPGEVPRGSPPKRSSPSSGGGYKRWSCDGHVTMIDGLTSCFLGLVEVGGAVWVESSSPNKESDIFALDLPVVVVAYRNVVMYCSLMHSQCDWLLP